MIFNRKIQFYWQATSSTLIYLGKFLICAKRMRYHLDLELETFFQLSKIKFVKMNSCDRSVFVIYIIYKMISFFEPNFYMV